MPEFSAGQRRVDQVARWKRVPGIGLGSVPLRVTWATGAAWWRARNGDQDGEVPAPVPTAAFVAQVALDEAVLGLLRNPARYPSPEEMRRVAGELDVLHALLRARGWLDDPRGFHPGPAVPDVAEGRSGWAHGVRYQRLSWASGYAAAEGIPGAERWSADAANATAHVWLLRHPGRPRPWLLCLHGMGTGAAFMDFFAFRARRLHEDLGLNLAFPVLPLHGPRRGPGVGVAAFMSHDLPAMVLAWGQAMWDLRGLLRWLRGQGAGHVGAYGISLGGYAAALLAALEPLDLVMAGVPLADLPDLVTRHAPARLRRIAVVEGMLNARTREVFRVVSPLALPALVPPDRRFLYGGLGDRMSTWAQARQLWLHWERPAALWYQGNHLSFLWTAAVQRYVEDALVTLAREAPSRHAVGGVA